MKNKLCSVLIILFLSTTLYGCAEQTKPTAEPSNLVIDYPEPATSGTLRVYAEGVAEMEYQGEIRIINDGQDGEPIEIEIQVGDTVE